VVGDRRRIELAAQLRDNATTKLRSEVQRAFPIGTRVSVRLGRAVVTGRVVGYGSTTAFAPDEVWIENEVTGKQRRFTATYHEWTIERG